MAPGPSRLEILGCIDPAAPVADLLRTTPRTVITFGCVEIRNGDCPVDATVTDPDAPHRRLIRDYEGVTDGLAVLAAWLMFCLLLVALSAVILRGRK